MAAAFLPAAPLRRRFLRSNTFGAVARVRDTLADATHKFFQENGFVFVTSPIITASDCEGAGEQFCVTTKGSIREERVEEELKKE